MQSDLKRAYAAAEAISLRDQSSLYRVSQFFHDHNRYLAFVSMYSVMRQIDDLLDDDDRRRVGDDPVTRRALETLQRRVSDAILGTETPRSLIDVALVETFRRFPPIDGTWDRYFEAMRHDLNRNPFLTFEEFREYCDGASGSPTTIFVQLIFSDSAGDTAYQVDRGDCLRAGLALGEWAYVIHNLRDLRKDVLSTPSVLQFDQSTLAACHLSQSELLQFARAGPGAVEADDRFSTFVQVLLQRAERAKAAARTAIARLGERASANQRFMLALIIGAYQSLAEQIASNPAAILEADFSPLSDKQLSLEIAKAAKAVGLDAIPRTFTIGERLSEMCP